MLTSDLDYPARILLDTHVWVWASTGETQRLRKGCAKAIESAALHGRLWASAASVWELALKISRGELQIFAPLHDWLAEQRTEPGIRIGPLSVGVLIDSTLLPSWIRKRDGKEHRDPNDRFIVTSARRRRFVLVTCDEEILEYAHQGHLTAYDARP